MSWLGMSRIAWGCFIAWAVHGQVLAGPGGGGGFDGDVDDCRAPTCGVPYRDPAASPVVHRPFIWGQLNEGFLRSMIREPLKRCVTTYPRQRATVRLQISRRGLDSVKVDGDADVTACLREALPRVNEHWRSAEWAYNVREGDQVPVYLNVGGLIAREPAVRPPQTSPRSDTKAVTSAATCEGMRRCSSKLGVCLRCDTEGNPEWVWQRSVGTAVGFRDAVSRTELPLRGPDCQRFAFTPTGQPLRKLGLGDAFAWTYDDQGRVVSEAIDVAHSWLDARLDVDRTRLTGVGDGQIDYRTRIDWDAKDGVTSMSIGGRDAVKVDFDERGRIVRRETRRSRGRAGHHDNQEDVTYHSEGSIHSVHSSGAMLNGPTSTTWTEPYPHWPGFTDEVLERTADGFVVEVKRRVVRSDGTLSEPVILRWERDGRGVPLRRTSSTGDTLDYRCLSAIADAFIEPRPDPRSPDVDTPSKP